MLLSEDCTLLPQHEFSQAQGVCLCLRTAACKRESACVVCVKGGRELRVERHERTFTHACTHTLSPNAQLKFKVGEQQQGPPSSNQAAVTPSSNGAGGTGFSLSHTNHAPKAPLPSPAAAAPPAAARPLSGATALLLGAQKRKREEEQAREKQGLHPPSSTLPSQNPAKRPHLEPSMPPPQTAAGPPKPKLKIKVKGEGGAAPSPALIR